MCVFTVFLVPDKIASYVSVRVKQCESAVRYVILGKPGILSIHSQYIYRTLHQLSVSRPSPKLY
jgi:hypothetical protein